jgi:hypothetical protein
MNMVYYSANKLNQLFSALLLVTKSLHKKLQIILNLTCKLLEHPTAGELCVSNIPLAKANGNE